MKVDELLKRLENVEIENEIHEIGHYLGHTFSSKKRRYLFHIMMKDKKTIYDIVSYRELLEDNKVSPGDAYVFIENDYLTKYDLSIYFYPFLDDRRLLPYAYLSKLGFEYDDVVPATGLKYVVTVNHFLDVNRTVVEVVDIDTAAINTNLLTLIRGSIKNIGYYELQEIVSQLDSQKLFAGHDSKETRRILHRYYESHDTSLAKEVEAIRNAYNHIFRPHRVECKRLPSQFSIIWSSIRPKD